MQLTNLEDEEGKSNFEWEVKLPPKSGEGSLKVLQVKDVFEKCSVKYATTFTLK